MAVTERLLLRTVYDGVRKILPGEFPPGSGLGFGELTRGDFPSTVHDDVINSCVNITLSFANGTKQQELLHNFSIRVDTKVQSHMVLLKF